MSIPLDADDLSLFNRLGKIGGAFEEQDELRATTLQDRVDTIVAGYDTEDQDLSEGMYPLLTSTISSQTAYLESLRTLAQNTIIRMADDDAPLVPFDLETAILRVYTQMVAANEQLDSNTSPTVAMAEDAGNTGDGEAVASVQHVGASTSNNLNVVVNAYHEVITLECVSDRFSGAEEGQEEFRVTSPPLQDALSHLWPGGSGLDTTLTAVDATLDNDGGNILTNSDFEDFDANVPDNWAITVGSAGSSILQDGSNEYSGSSCLKLVGDGSTQLELRQQLGNAAGTLGEVDVNRMYLVSVMLKGGDTLAAGQLRFGLIDSGGTNVAMQFQAVALTGIDTTYTRHSVILVTPNTLPTTVYLQVKTSTALANTKQLFVDHLAMTELEEGIYPDGPPLAVFSGVDSFLVGDKLTVTVTNSDQGEFQKLLDRLFDMKGLGLQLPASNAPEIDDALIV